jgi:GntR family transcriptional regulator/MocR family aminotransferase
MQSGDFERHMRKMRSLYHKKHDMLLQAIQHAFQGIADIIGAGSGLHILLRVRNGMSETQLVHTAKQKGVNVYPTSVYALEQELTATSTVLLGFGGVSETDIRAGIELLKRAWSADKIE